MTEWFADESFWIETYPFMFPPERMAKGLEEVEKVLRLTGLEGGSAVLDFCCGPGRHAVPLAKRGFTVTAVDRSPFLLGKARKRARAARVAVEWVEEDMRRFVRPGAFDGAVSLFNSFGYLADREEDLAVLRTIHRSLKPGGVLLLDVMGKEELVRIFQETSSEKLDDGALLVQRHEAIEDFGRTRNEWIVIREGRARSFTFELNVYSGWELKESLRRAGFAAVSLFGNLDGGPYGLGAERLVAVARKEE